MSTCTLDDLRQLDLKYAEEGIYVHQRPFRAAMEILGGAFVMGPGGNPEVKRVMDAYTAMTPEVKTSWPGAGSGLAAAVDQVRKLTFPIVFGRVLVQPWKMAGFSSAEEWWSWCRQEPVIAGDFSLAAADLHDFTNGLSEVDQIYPAAETLWRMARSNLENVANTLPTIFSHDSVIQPVFLVAELSMKAALVQKGADPDSFRRGKNGHNLALLARRMARVCPHRDDPRIEAVVAGLPPYVESRYKPVGLKRLQVVKLAVGVQFVAASSLRRITGTDLARQMEDADWPSARPPFLI